jgi:hypothetical protein
MVAGITVINTAAGMAALVAFTGTLTNLLTCL